MFIEVNKNGDNYNVTPNVEVQANKEIEITENGEIEITPDTGNVAMQKVTANISVSGGGEAQTKAVTVYPSETTSVEPDSGKNLTRVDITGHSPIGGTHFYAYTKSNGSKTVLFNTGSLSAGTKNVLKPMTSGNSPITADFDVIETITISSVASGSTRFVDSEGTTWLRDVTHDYFGYYPKYSHEIPITTNGTQTFSISDSSTSRCGALNISVTAAIPTSGVATLLGTGSGAQSAITINFDPDVTINPGDWVVILNTASLGSAITLNSAQKMCWIGCAYKSGVSTPVIFEGMEGTYSGALTWTVTATGATSSNYGAPSATSFAAYVLKVRN